MNLTSPETRMIVLPVAEERTIVSFFIWTKDQNVADRQTDGQPMAITAVCTASNAVKTCYKHHV